jgi:hypothetical protein
MAYNKYHVSAKVDRTFQGHVFDSKAEMHHYQELKLLEKAREIAGLEIQPEFLLQKAFTDKAGKKHREINYRADFIYFDNKLEKCIVEDVKGMLTEVYKIKRKLFLFRYPEITLKEI